jgi:hypothetical protein
MTDATPTSNFESLIALEAEDILTPDIVEANTEDEVKVPEETPDVEETSNVPENKAPENLDIFASLTFEEPKAPELASEKYLKAWSVNTLDDLKGENEILFELLTQIDTLQKEKYETEKVAYDLKTIPEVKAAVVTQQTGKYIAENADAWAGEFTNDILTQEEVKLLNKFNKTQQKELEAYVDSIIPEYVLDRKVNNKTIYNPFIVFKHEIKTKLAEIGTTIAAKNHPTKQPTQDPTLSIDDRKKLISNSGAISTIPAPNNPIQTKAIPNTRFQSLIDLGI